MRTAVRAHHVGLTVTDLDRAGSGTSGRSVVMQLAFDLPGGARGAMLRSADGARVELFEVQGSVDGRARRRSRGGGWRSSTISTAI